MMFVEKNVDKRIMNNLILNALKLNNFYVFQGQSLKQLSCIFVENEAKK